MHFNIIPAKPTFGNLREPLYASDYLQLKKNKLNVCFTKQVGKEVYAANKSNLNANLITKQNLSGVCSLSQNYMDNNSMDDDNNNTCCQKTNITNSNVVPFYQQYRIDPKGELFGNTQCGVNNFTNYMELIKVKVNKKRNFG